MTKLSRQRVNTLLKSFSKQKTLIMGDLMVDKYVWGIGIRLSSEAPVPVIRVDREEYRSKSARSYPGESDGSTLLGDRLSRYDRDCGAAFAENRGGR